MTGTRKSARAREAERKREREREREGGRSVERRRKRKHHIQQAHGAMHTCGMYETYTMQCTMQ